MLSPPPTSTLFPYTTLFRSVLIDRDQPSADKGKAHSEKMISEQIARGRATAADKDALLARITATADFAVLKDCDLVIEAVDRKSTRLNSSHLGISYAVFCLK